MRGPQESNLQALPTHRRRKLVSSFDSDSAGRIFTNYLKKFMNYSVLLPEMAKSVLMDVFVIGLEPELKAEVMSHPPTSLEQYMKEAQLVPTSLEQYMKEAQLVNDQNIALEIALSERQRRIQMVELSLIKVSRETEVALQSIMGFSTKGTIKLRGKVIGQSVLILNDNGATHNFC